MGQDKSNYTNEDLKLFETDVNNLFESFPLQELWRFVIDGHRQGGGIYFGEIDFFAFDKKEPGYLQATLATLIHAHTSSTPETTNEFVDYINKLHSSVLENVMNVGKTTEQGKKVTGIQNSNESCGLMLGKNISPEGAKEFEMPNNEIPGYLKDGKYKGINKIDASRAQIEEYLKTKQNPVTDKITRLKALIKLVSELERIHPLFDCNCRTFAMALLQSEMLKMGLVPPIVDDPNYFDGFSQAELLDMVVEGMKRTKQIIDGKDSENTLTLQFNVFNYSDKSEPMQPVQKKVTQHAFKEVDWLRYDLVLYQIIKVQQLQGNLKQSNLTDWMQEVKSKAKAFLEDNQSQPEIMTKFICNNLHNGTTVLFDLCQNELKQFLMDNPSAVQQINQKFENETHANRCFYPQSLFDLIVACNSDELKKNAINDLIKKAPSLYTEYIKPSNNEIKWKYASMLQSNLDKIVTLLKNGVKLDSTKELKDMIQSMQRQNILTIDNQAKELLHQQGVAVDSEARNVVTSAYSSVSNKEPEKTDTVTSSPNVVPRTRGG